MPIVAELLARGSDLYQYAGEGLRTLVYAAARHGHHGMLKYLIARGLSPDFIAGDLWTPLCINYMACPEAVVTPLAVAVKTLDLEMIGILLQAGADPNRKSIGIPPLHLAMGSPFSARESVDYYAQMERSHAAIDLLLQYGADINAQSDDGQTFLSKVVSAGLMETAMHLVESGADLHLPGSQGKLPVDYAREAQNAIMTRYLEQEMKLRPKLAAHQLIEKFMSSYLEPALKKRGYQRHEGTWWQSRGDYFLVIHMQPFSWITDGFAFCFNIGAAKSSDLRNTDNDRVIIDDCFAHAPETAFLSGSWEKHPFKRNVGYSVTEHAQPANFIRALTEDFENEILPCLESLDSLEDITEKLAVKFDLN
jgi:hypothetical protein